MPRALDRVGGAAQDAAIVNELHTGKITVPAAAQTMQGNSSSTWSVVDSSVREAVFPLAGFKRSAGVLLQLSGYMELPAAGSYSIQVGHAPCMCCTAVPPPTPTCLPWHGMLQAQ